MKVTVLSGFLGAGKTTLLKRILRENNRRGDGEKLKIAVIVNDMGEINLDADEIKHSKLVQEEAEMVELHNGCICCTLRGDLLKTVKSLSEEKAFDYVVIESTGISEPLPVAQTFVMDVGSMLQTPGEPTTPRKLTVAATEPESLSHYATLDTMVTVVDALNIYEVLGSIETLSEENASQMVGYSGTKKDGGGNNGGAGGEPEEDNRSLAQLMLDQIEFANVIVLSKAQILLEKESEKKLDEIKALLQKLCPKARILAPRKDKYGDLDVGRELLNTGRFDMEEARQSAGWRIELEKGEHAPETEEYGISSTIFRAKNMPFHPERLGAVLNGFGDYGSAVDASVGGGAGPSGERDVFKGVVRSKGHLWLANANAFPMSIHTAGKHLTVVPIGAPFLAATDRDDWDEEGKNVYKELVKTGRWNEQFGDRGSEIVFIGVNLNKTLIEAKLKAALLTADESVALGGVKGWGGLGDPFFGGQCAEHYFEVQYASDGEEDEEEEEEEEEDEEEEGEEEEVANGVAVQKKRNKPEEGEETNEEEGGNASSIHNKKQKIR